MECKHSLTIQIIFLSEMDVNKIRYRMNWRDNYLVSETVSQLSSHNNVKTLFAGEAALTTSHADEPR